MSQGIEHQVGNEQKNAEQSAQCQRPQMTGWMNRQVGNPSRNCPWFDEHIPTVQSQKTAHVNSNAAETGDHCDEQPTCQASGDSRDYVLHQEQRQKAQHQTRKRARKDQNQVHPKMPSMTASQVNHIRKDVRSIWKKEEPASRDGKEMPAST